MDNDNEKITGFTFFKSYDEAFQDLNKDEAYVLLKAMLDYVFRDIEPSMDELPPKLRAAKISWKLIHPILETNIKKAKGGKKGGRPKK